MYSKWNVDSYKLDLYELNEKNLIRKLPHQLIPVCNIQTFKSLLNCLFFATWASICSSSRLRTQQPRLLHETTTGRMVLLLRYFLISENVEKPINVSGREWEAKTMRMEWLRRSRQLGPSVCAGGGQAKQQPTTLIINTIAPYYALQTKFIRRLCATVH